MAIVAQEKRTYITGTTLDKLNCFLIAEVLPQPVRGKYDKLVVGLYLVFSNLRFRTENRLLEGSPEPELAMKRLSVILGLFRYTSPIDLDSLER
ncbi:hypothetical protein PR202_ga27139 [Eleusine coracana subsp. coracana]|uniref:Uncharacterized protein n=1 Tax=Eleusine coracana subsp. coracana TaxID=191504 RepID=A0AAV5DFZ6_ELECO|nr:hypothetical protein PR202_ga27139 [Eleusine coracana subsp. coracana]